MRVTGEAELTKLESRRAHAIVSGDIETLAALTDDNYVRVEASGRVSDKQGFLAGAAPSRGFFESYTLIDNNIRLFGDVAIVTGTFENCFVSNAGERTQKFARHIRVYVLRPEGWRNVSHQATLVDNSLRRKSSEAIK